MSINAPELQVFRRRIAKMLRRAENDPLAGAQILREETGTLLAELRRLAKPEPATVLEVLLGLLERLAATLVQIEDERGVAGGLIPEVIGRVRALLRREARSGGFRVDRAQAIERLFRLWFADPEGHFHELEQGFLEIAATPADEEIMRGILRTHLARLPLVFPPLGGADDDIQRVLLLAERHRSERLLGELLARRGCYEYSVMIARDHFRRTGDALDLISALHRSGQVEEAVTAARKALASPRSFQRQRIQDLLDKMLAGSAISDDRHTRRELEQGFLAEPSLAAFAALKRVVPADQWPRVRSRVLGHLQKHQKAPSLVFLLHLEEGSVLEADGLVVTQPVDPEVLSDAAARVASEHPAIAAGWYLFAAHRRAGLRRPAEYPQVVRDLEAVRLLAERTGQGESLKRILERFRGRHAAKTRLVRMLEDAGLG